MCTQEDSKGSKAHLSRCHLKYITTLAASVKVEIRTKMKFCPFRSNKNEIRTKMKSKFAYVLPVTLCWPKPLRNVAWHSTVVRVPYRRLRTHQTSRVCSQHGQAIPKRIAGKLLVMRNWLNISRNSF